jgi:hypothetical protein
VADTPDTGPRSLHCPACLDERVHHFHHAQRGLDGTLSWFRCECGNLRALDFVAAPQVVGAKGEA